MKAGPAGEAGMASPSVGRRPSCLSLTLQRMQCTPQVCPPIRLSFARCQHTGHMSCSAVPGLPPTHAGGHHGMSSAGPPTHYLSHTMSLQGRDPWCCPLGHYTTKSSHLPSGEGRTSLARRCSHSHLFSAGHKSWGKDNRYLALTRDTRDAKPIGMEGWRCPPLWAGAGREQQISLTTQTPCLSQL